MVLTGTTVIHTPRSVSTLHVKYIVGSQLYFHCWHLARMLFIVTDNTVSISRIMELLFTTTNNSTLLYGPSIPLTLIHHNVKGPWQSTQHRTWAYWLPVTFERWHLQELIRLARHRTLLNAHWRIATARTTTAFVWFVYRRCQWLKSTHHRYIHTISCWIAVTWHTARKSMWQLQH